MILRNRNGLVAVVLGAGLIFALGVTAVGQATHIRPKAATPIREALIPAVTQCVAPNRQHGPPFALPSCNPPVTVSPHLTVGTADNNGLPTNMASHVRLDMQLAPPDMLLQAVINDQYCKSTFAGACFNTGESLNDYIGGLAVQLDFRVSDHWNNVSPGGGPDAATVVDFPFPWSVACAAVGPGPPGGQCSASTSVNAMVAGGVKTGKRESWEVRGLVVQDGGSDSDPVTTPNNTWLVRGLFQP